MRNLQHDHVTLVIAHDLKRTREHLAELIASRAWNIQGIEHVEVVPTVTPYGVVDDTMPVGNAYEQLAKDMAGVEYKAALQRPQPFIVRGARAMELWLGVKKEDGTIEPIAGPLAMPADWREAYYAALPTARDPKKPRLFARIIERLFDLKLATL